MTTPQTPVDALAAQARVFAYDIQAHHISDALADKIAELLNQCADQLEASARALAAILEQQAGGVPAGFVLGEYLHKFMGKGEGIVRRFYNGEDQSVVDAGAWIQEANQLFQVLAAAPSPTAVPPLSEAQIDAAAKKLAECMDYPWEHMPEQGRNSMREHAKAVIEAGIVTKEST
jgi:hypothetical protein